MKALEYTNKGCRESNQDYVKKSSLGEGTAIYVVADGMGGYAYGELAAKVVSESIVDYVAEHVSKMTPSQLLTNAYKFANESLNIKRMILNAKEMGCVAVALLINDGMAYMAWLGDSRIYMYRDGQEVFKTDDHSMVAELSKIRSLSLSELDRYSSIVTRALMGDDEDVTPSLMKSEIQEGDVFVLSSDGLHKQWLMSDIVSSSEDTLVANLEDASAKMDDNYSFIKVTI